LTENIWVIKAEVPEEWKPKVLKKMKEKGYRTVAELLRDLVREFLEN